MENETVNNFEKAIEKNLLIKDFKLNLTNLQKQKQMFSSNDFSMNHFYFENITDDEFLTENIPNDDMLAFYHKIAKSGVGIAILGGININYDTEKLLKNNIAKNKFNKITSMFHVAGTKVLFKLKTNIGRFVYTKSKYRYASNFNFNNKERILVRISDGKIKKIISNVSHAVDFACFTNFDGIVIDAGISNIMGELCSQEYNKRIFGYFNEIEDFLLKTLNTIKQKNVFICLKINISSLFLQNKTEINYYTEQKLNIEKMFKILTKYIKHGVDAFEFEFGEENNKFLTEFNCFENELLFKRFYINFTEYLNKLGIFNKFGNNIALFCHDNILNYNNIADAIENKIVNYFDITKELYTNTNFIYNLKGNNLNFRCIKCNYCETYKNIDTRIECVLNPSLKDFKKQNNYNSKKNIAIVGCGISAIYCIMQLEGKGYNIDVFEKEKEINITGKLNTIFGFDYLLDEFNIKLENQIIDLIEKQTINLYTNIKFEATDEVLKKYDSIVIATGFQCKSFSVSGAVLPHVQNIYDVLKNKFLLDCKKEIVIYCKTELSIKLAFYLCVNGFKISLIIKNPNELLKSKNANLLFFFYNLYKYNANILFFTNILKVNEDNIEVLTLTKKAGNGLKLFYDITNNVDFCFEKCRSSLDCDLLIYEPDIIPNNKLFFEIVNKNYSGELYLIGNALENGSFSDIIKSGYFVGKNL